MVSVSCVKKAGMLFSCVSLLAFFSTASFSQDNAMRLPDGLKKSMFAIPVNTAKLIFTEISQPPLPKGMKPTPYTDLAQKYRQKIDRGRAAAGVTSATFDMLSGVAGMLIAAPEPTTTAIGVVLAVGADMTSSAIQGQIIEDARRDANALLRAGLAENELTSDAIKAMKASELKKFVSDFQVNGKKMDKILDEEGRELVQAELLEMATNISLENAEAIEQTNEQVDKLTEGLAKTASDLADFKSEIDRRTKKVEDRLDKLSGVVQEHSDRLRELSEEVANNTDAIAAVASISFSGWTTPQKLQAVRAGLVTGLKENEKAALIRTLEAQRKQEIFISQLNTAASSLQAVGQIAQNLGLPEDVAKAATVAGTVASGIAQIAAGGPSIIGGVAVISSLANMGKPDAGAARHRQMMYYLAQQFKAIHDRFDQIEKLQIQTLEQLSALQKQQAAFRKEVMAKLGLIETIVLADNAILRALLREEWRSCDALANNGIILGNFRLEDRNSLLKIVKDSDVRRHARGCYLTMSRYLDANILGIDWGQGDIISATAAPLSGIADPETQKRYIKLVGLEVDAYQKAATLVINYATSKKWDARPSEVLARVGYPFAKSKDRMNYEAALQKSTADGAFQQFSCKSNDPDEAAMVGLMCHGSGAADSPESSRFAKLLTSPLLGPQVEVIARQGMLAASLADISFKDDADELTLISEEDILKADEDPSEELLRALDEKNGSRILRKLEPLVEMYVLQKLTAYGDFTAAVAEEALYDSSTRTLDPKKRTPEAIAALVAMEANPTLARNVVLLGIRHAIADQLGGYKNAENASFLMTRYRYAVDGFMRGQRCSTDWVATQEWNSLLPGWQIEYRRQSEDGDNYAQCPEPQFLNLESDDNPHLGLGSGPSVRISDGGTIDFYVTLPNPQQMSSGSFERTESLVRAMGLRDLLKQEITNRQIGELIAAAVAGEEDKDAAFDKVAFDLIAAYGSNPQ